ncbi:MAG: DUF3124 domain-containing protein [Geobacteraceae bacterium]|nr:DUF3124 domain-containing protein [Geobacteraceae bacterium]
MSFSNRLLTFFAVGIFCLTSMASIGWSAEPQRSRGQTVYVPAYSHVFTGPRANPYNLAITLTVRNTDPRDGMVVTVIDYYDHNGRLIRRYTPSPLSLTPLASSYIHLEEKDTSGGFAPKFIVRWESQRPISPPIIESIMIGATSGQGISFVSQGQVIQDR